MVQGGDPTGSGKGGECIWGGLMDDEFHPALKVRARMDWVGLGCLGMGWGDQPFRAAPTEVTNTY